MEWTSKLYIGERAAKKAETVRKQIDKNSCRGKWEIITLSVHEGETLVIRPAKQLAREWVREACPLIVGLAADHKEAIGLVQRITQDCIRDTGTLLLKEYLTC